MGYNEFLEIMGRSNMMRVLEYLLDQELDVSVSDICDGTNLSRKTVDLMIAKLLQNELIIVKRNIGNTKLYEVNNDNLIMKKILEINKLVLKKQEEKILVKTN